MAAGPSLAGRELAGNPQALPCGSALSSLHFSMTREHARYCVSLSNTLLPAVVPAGGQSQGTASL